MTEWAKWLEQLKQALFQAVEMLGSRDMTAGTLFLLLGAVGIAVSIIALFVCMAVFPRKRKKLLKSLENAEE